MSVTWHLSFSNTTVYTVSPHSKSVIINSIFLSVHLFCIWIDDFGTLLMFFDWNKWCCDYIFLSTDFSLTFFSIYHTHGLHFRREIFLMCLYNNIIAEMKQHDFAFCGQNNNNMDEWLEFSEMLINITWNRH